MEEKLDRSLSKLNVWALAFGCIIGWGAFVLPAQSFLPKAGPLGTALGMVIAALIMIIIVFNYHYMIRMFPEAGGEFTYTRRAFGKKHAFVCSWFLGLSYTTLVPMNSTALALVGRNLLGNVFQRGFHYNLAGYDIYMGELLLALGAIFIFGILNIRGVKVIGNLQLVLSLSLVTSVLIITLAAVFSPLTSIENLKPAFSPSLNAFSGVLCILAVAPYCFVGFDTVPQAAEEFHFSAAKTKWIMVISILFGCFVYTSLALITIYVLPSGYSGWPDYVSASGAFEGIKALPTFYAVKMLLGNLGLLFIGIAVCAAILSGITGFYMASSRLLYSMSRHEVIPSWFSRVHEKYRTPANAVLFIMLLSFIAPFFGRNVLGWLVDMSSLGAAIGYGYTSAAALKYARREKNRGIMITGVLGIIMAVIFAGLLLVPIPLFGCSLSTPSYICLAVWIIIGLVFYTIRKQ